MSDFAGMEELLQDFLTESSELLSDVDNKLVELEKYPEDKGLLNDIFRGFHTIKGGAGFLNATPLVTLCHRTENLFDKLRNGELQLNSHVMDVILDATGVVRDMFGDLAQSRMPAPAPQHILDNLDAMLAGQDMVRTVPGLPAVPDPASVSQPASPPPGRQYHCRTGRTGHDRSSPAPRARTQHFRQPAGNHPARRCPAA